MTDFQRLLHGAREDQVSNFETHVNPAFSELLRTLGHRHSFVRGEGARLWDEQGQCYLDCVAGYAVHAIGRSHPRMVNALREAHFRTHRRRTSTCCLFEFGFGSC
jgi:acetylornithine/succinyldiaminopimelate/putrescine aminotransferase